MSRYLLVILLIVGTLPTLLAPLVVNAQVPEPFIFQTQFVGMPRMPINMGILQTALRTGNSATLWVLACGSTGKPDITVDLSALGYSSAATTEGSFAGYSAPCYPPYFYDFGSLTIGSSVADGAYDLPITATSPSGVSATSSIRLVVDNRPPVLVLSDLSFSTISPQQGDVMYLSGLGDGTGSAISAREMSITPEDANGVPLSSSGLGADFRTALNMIDAIRASPDGSFSRLPIVLDDVHSGQLARAEKIEVRFTLYDEAGNTSESSIVATVPKKPPPDPCVSTGTCASNVLFLPGIEGSRLYRPDYNGGTDRLWEPSGNQDVVDLQLKPDGTSVRSDVYTKTGDVIDEIPVAGANIYKSFIAKMNELKANQVINNWEPIAYDWRLSLDDILQNGNQFPDGRTYYSGDLAATSSAYIVQELRQLAASSKTGKVTIIAHSNGGLVAKRLTEILGPESSKLIDKMIFVAVPQAGTPATIAADMHGIGQNFGNSLIVNESTARTFASTSPMAYDLLPSAQYFTQVDDPVVTFDPSLPDWIARYGATIHSQETLHTFLTDAYGRANASTGDVNQPIQLSETLLSDAESLHDDLDAWTPPTGVQLVQIAGWGLSKTISGIMYKRNGAVAHAEPHFTIDGDGTVVVPSALWTSATTGVLNYWFDLDSYNKKHPLLTLSGFHPFDHSNILEPGEILELLSDQISNTTKTSSDYQFLSTQAPVANTLRLRYALHSPLTLNLYDDQGRHTGVSTSTGQIEEQIPGTYYTKFGDVKYLFSDASTTAHIAMDGYATGTFTFNVDQYNGDTLTASTTFRDIPTTSSTTVTLDIKSDITTLSPMNIDKNGDGLIDTALAPKMNDTVTLDTTPPEYEIRFSTTTRSIVFAASDDSGNATVTATTTVIAASKEKKGEKDRDNASITTLTARDAAGNTTTIRYTENPSSNEHRDSVTILSISYNGATTTRATKLKYKWEIDKTGEYKTFASYLNTASSTIESHYRPKKNTTILMSKPQDMSDSDTDDNSDARQSKLSLAGMVVPYVITNAGSVIISY